MNDRIKEVVTDTLGEDGVSFVEDGKYPQITLRERATAIATPENVVGNIRYAMRLMGMDLGNGRHNGETPESSINGTSNLIIPGYAGRNKNFSSFRSSLEDYGVHSKALHPYEDLRLISPLTTTEATSFVKQKIEESPAETVNLICHSMGGIIALIACGELDDETLKKVGRIVTLGTPWHGTPLAQLLALFKRYDSALRELFPKSETLEKRVQGINGRVREKIVSIGSVSDLIVPWKSSMLEGSHVNAILRRDKAVTHANFLHDEHVAQLVAAILNESENLKEAMLS